MKAAASFEDSITLSPLKSFLHPPHATIISRFIMDLYISNPRSVITEQLQIGCQHLSLAAFIKPEAGSFVALRCCAVVGSSLQCPRVPASVTWAGRITLPCCRSDVIALCYCCCKIGLNTCCFLLLHSPSSKAGCQSLDLGSLYHCWSLKSPLENKQGFISELWNVCDSRSPCCHTRCHVLIFFFLLGFSFFFFYCICHSAHT